MSVTITLTVTDEFNAQIELMCKLNTTNKSKFISSLIRDEVSVFFKNRKEIELQEEFNKNTSTMRKNWGLDSELTNNNLINIGKSIAFPPAY